MNIRPIAFAAALTLIAGCNPASKQAARPVLTKTADGRNELKVGFLPVTCHLTCPVTDFASRTSKDNRFASEKYLAWPDVANAFKSGRLQATFMIAPLALKLQEQGVKCKIVYLGHRDGSTVMVRKDDTSKDLTGLKGKTFAIPSRFSNQYLVIRKLMEDQGLGESDINFVELPPPQMPTALAAKKIDAYFVGEPHAAKAEVTVDDGSPIQTMKTAFHSLLKFAGVPIERNGGSRTIYSLRHFYATMRLSNDTSPFLLARQMGTSVEMLEKFYGQTVSSALAARISKGNQTVGDGNGYFGNPNLKPERNATTELSEHDGDKLGALRLKSSAQTYLSANYLF